VLKIKHLQMYVSQSVWVHEDPKTRELALLHNIAASTDKSVANTYHKPVANRAVSFSKDNIDTGTVHF